MVPWPLGSRPLLLFLLLVLRGLLLLLGLLVLRDLLLGLGFLVLRGLRLVGLVLRSYLVGLVLRGLLLVRSAEEAREETQLRKQNQDQQDYYNDQKANYQPGGSTTSVCLPSALLVHFSIVDDREEDRNHDYGPASASRDPARNHGVVTEQRFGIAVEKGARVDQAHREKAGITSLAKRSTISGS